MRVQTVQISRRLAELLETPCPHYAPSQISPTRRSHSWSVGMPHEEFDEGPDNVLISEPGSLQTRLEAVSAWAEAMAEESACISTIERFG